MTTPERGKLIPVTGNNDTPQNDEAIDVQFNPTTLKVSLSNTLKENQRNGNSRAAQFVDKSSSSLTVELIFDTTFVDNSSDQGTGSSDSASSNSGSSPSSGGSSSQGSSANQIQQGSDVRNLTKKIAETFLKPRAGSNNRKKAPRRCLFQWGSFEFIGLVESYEETLDFFSKEGRPLRATLSLKLKEDRFQFRQRTEGVAAAQTDDPPTLSPTGNADSAADNNADSNGAGDQPPGEGATNPANEAAGQSASPVPGNSDGKGSSWRDNAMFNGCENPRLPSGSMLALPSASLSASVNIKASASAGVGASFSAGAGVSSGFSAGASAGVSASAGASVQSGVSASASSVAQVRVTPAFNFGASSSLGTGIEGAFNATGELNQQLNATGVINGSTPLRVSSSDQPVNASYQKRWQYSHQESLPPAAPGVGFD
ncbi:hypothetical protein BTA51_26635 [Hahella sp. CCB-MM4]|uniref:CIS tube protein n=1 Tax=Hahella sp. (strain CCB-MM4) TaxID=1926491 RepID=UPI000BD6D9FF|nr:hypothetical protein [Hahella sp. CCB-MM4]OZG70301.1 hypothetical protein BTA51_26635 [Hahella sp. CCB-MM4]